MRPARPARSWSTDRAVFVAAIPDEVDGGARICAVGDFCPADGHGGAAAVVLADWGQDDLDEQGHVLHRWGTHVMTYEADLGCYLLWRARYRLTLHEAWADLHARTVNPVISVNPVTLVTPGA